MTFKKNIVLESTLLTILLILAILFREKPSTSDEVPMRLSVTDNTTLEKSENVIRGDSSNGQLVVKPVQEKKVVNRAELLVRRNPFTPEGSYSDLMIPENPYTLVAVLNEKQRRALLRLFTGEIQAIKEGDILVDGARVLKIEEKSVIIEWLGKRQELKLLHIEVERWQIKK